MNEWLPLELIAILIAFQQTQLLYLFVEMQLILVLLFIFSFNVCLNAFLKLFLFIYLFIYINIIRYFQLGCKERSHMMQFEVLLSLWSVTSWLCINKIPEVAKSQNQRDILYKSKDSAMPP